MVTLVIARNDLEHGLSTPLQRNGQIGVLAEDSSSR